MEGVDVQKQNKHITIVVPAESGTGFVVTNTIIADINTAAGSTILTALA